MKKMHVSFNGKNNRFSDHTDKSKAYSGASIDRPLALILGLALLPVFIFNTLFALIRLDNTFRLQYKMDALGRPVTLRAFTFGWFKHSAILFDIILGNLGFCGVSCSHKVSKKKQHLFINKAKIKTGIFSLYDLHLKTGLTVTSEDDLFEQQLNGSFINYLTLLMKSMLCTFLYGSKSNNLKNTKELSLFGLKIKNTSMKEAVDWITQNSNDNIHTKLGFFINVNSINLSINNYFFSNQLKQADALFVDGSGMRLAAAKAGYRLNGNNNGTDMLPHLCRSAIKNNQSLYLFGAQPTIAAKAAKNLKGQFPGLMIAGVQHGYSNLSDDELIADINKSNCDVLLVAMGSPIQEQWLIDNKDKLQCKTALAVGGLFDFYSGAISRSPMWLRELGMEWVWRLMQEPLKKFNRYVIGTPLFLYRTFFLNLANTGEK